MKITLTIKGKPRVFHGRVPLESLLHDEGKEIIAAKVNNRVRELRYEVYFDANIDFLKYHDSEAVRIYETSLRYLVAMAIDRLYPQTEIRYSYSISRAISMHVLDESIVVDDEFVARLKEEIDSLIARDIPFNRKIVSNEKAAEFYRSKPEFHDKLAILDYRPEKTVHFYECDGYLNYMYGYMVPSTGYLHRYKIQRYNGHVLIRYPRNETNGEIPKFEAMPSYANTLKEAQAWALKMNTDTVAGINEYIENGQDVELINMSEARHNDMLAEIGKTIADNKDIRLIAIAGPSSSGKTTFSNRLRIELMSRGLRPIRISIDDYYLSDEDTPLDENGERDLESVNALDLDLFNKNMSDLIAGKEVTLPRFDFIKRERTKGRTLKVASDEPIIIEGIHALNEVMTASIPKKNKYKIYIAPQAQMNIDNDNPISLTDLRLLRRLVRDKAFRNSSAEETIAMWPSVRRGEFKWIYATEEDADYVFNSFLPYELPVMRKVAIPMLREIAYESEYFPTAERLLRLLKYFVDLDETNIPNNSLIREFIGGSVFEETK